MVLNLCLTRGSLYMTLQRIPSEEWGLYVKTYRAMKEAQVTRTMQ